MKKVLCLFLVVAMVTTCLPMSFAEDSELTRIVKLAKGRLEITEEFTEFYSDEYDAVGQKRYDLRWSTEDSRKRINVSILFDGEILSYNYNDYEYDYDRKGFAPFDKDEYTRRAKEWLERVNPTYAPEISDNIEVNIGGIYQTSVSVTFSREKDGIKVDGNYVSVSLDKFTGEVLSMYSNWTREQNIKSPEGVITQEDAAKILGEKANLKLRYHKLRDENRAVLMYTPEETYMMIDAFTGEDFSVEFIDAELGATSGGGGGGAVEAPMEDNATKEEAEVELSEKEIEAVEELESLLTKEALTAKIRKMSNTEIATFDVKTVNYRRVEIKGETKYIATVRLAKGADMTGSATFDAKTGELHSMSTYLPYRYGKKQNVKYDRMESNAFAFIRTWAPAIAGKAKNFNENQNSEYFYFTHNENGIEYRGNSINMRVDKETGKILSFSKNWDSDTIFDSPDGIITKEEATAKYTEASPPELLYIANKRVRYASNNAEELALIYRLPYDAPSYIDAVTGAAYDWNMGQAQEENPDDYVIQKDLSGHWAENIVKTLAENGIILSYEETFRPNEPITQKEIALLIACFEGGARPYTISESEYTACVQRMVNRGIIKKGEKNPDKKITREETVTYLVRLFGYEAAAELQGIFKTGFSDEGAISKDKLGYVAIAKGLGLVSGSGGKFSPQNNVTRAELAAMLYNALSR